MGRSMPCVSQHPACWQAWAVNPPCTLSGNMARGSIAAAFLAMPSCFEWYAGIHNPNPITCTAGQASDGYGAAAVQGGGRGHQCSRSSRRGSRPCSCGLCGAAATFHEPSPTCYQQLRSDVACCCARLCSQTGTKLAKWCRLRCNAYIEHCSKLVEF